MAFLPAVVETANSPSRFRRARSARASFTRGIWCARGPWPGRPLPSKIVKASSLTSAHFSRTNCSMRWPPVNTCNLNAAASTPGRAAMSFQYACRSDLENGRLSARSNCGDRRVCAAGLKTTPKDLKTTGIDAVVRTSSAHWNAARRYERSLLAVRPLLASISLRSMSSTWSGVTSTAGASATLGHASVACRLKIVLPPSE